MSDPDLYNNVVSIIASVLNIETGEINPEDELMTDLAANALDLINIMEKLDDRYNTTPNLIDGDGEGMYLSVNSIVEWYQRHL